MYILFDSNMDGGEPLCVSKSKESIEALKDKLEAQYKIYHDWMILRNTYTKVSHSDLEWGKKWDQLTKEFDSKNPKPELDHHFQYLIIQEIKEI